MIEHTEREMDASEREHFMSLLSCGLAPNRTAGTLRGTVIGIASLTISALIAALSVQSELNIVLKAGIGSIAAVIMILGIFAIVSTASYRRSFGCVRELAEKQSQGLRESIETGRVKVTKVRASAAAVINQFEDEGDIYLFDVGENKLFVLNNSLLTEPAKTGGWYALDFELVCLDELTYLKPAADVRSPCGVRSIPIRDATVLAALPPMGIVDSSIESLSHRLAGGGRV